MAKLSGWRKIAGAMWGAPDDPQVYGMLEFDATPMLDYMRRARAAGIHVTPTHFVGRAVAHPAGSGPGAERLPAAEPARTLSP